MLVRFFFGVEDILPMWIADMDFETTSFIINTIKERLYYSVLGYIIRSEFYYQVIINEISGCKYVLNNF
jgi:cystathionine beta-lyase